MPQIPFALEWTIPEYSFFKLKNTINCLLSTSISNIPEFEYYLSIFPNGFNEENRGRAWIGLQLDFKNVKQVKADYKIIINKKYSFEKHVIYEKSTGSGEFVAGVGQFYKLLRSSKGYKYIFDGKLTIKIYGIFKFERKTNISIAVEELEFDGNELWKNDDDKDFTIVVENKEIKVHKSILGSKSEIFFEMFNPKAMNSIENEKLIIEDFSFNVVNTAIKLIYNCIFFTSLKIHEKMALLRFFDKYNIQELKDKIEAVLIHQISPLNVCRLTNFSIRLNLEKLQNECYQFMKVCFLSNTCLNDYEILDENILNEVLKINYQIVETEKFYPF